MKRRLAPITVVEGWRWPLTPRAGVKRVLEKSQGRKPTEQEVQVLLEEIRNWLGAE
jgi:hypothetical protein